MWSRRFGACGSRFLNIVIWRLAIHKFEAGVTLGPQVLSPLLWGCRPQTKPWCPTLLGGTHHGTRQRSVHLALRPCWPPSSRPTRVVPEDSPTLQDPLWRASAKVGTIQRILAWPLHKGDTHKSGSVPKVAPHCGRSCWSSLFYWFGVPCWLLSFDVFHVGRGLPEGN